MLALGNTSIKTEEIVSSLKKDMSLQERCHKILHQKIIAQAAQERGVAVTPEEIQAEADRLRYEMRLEKASDTLDWLKEKMITADEWEAGIRDRLLANKLAKHLFNQEVEKYFAQNRLDFEQLILYQIVVPYEQVAQELFYQIEEQEISFFEAAHLYDIDERRRYCCGYEGKVSRWSFEADVATALFSAPVGEIVGPLKTDLGYHLFLVKEIIKAELTTQRRQEIIDNLFKDWLAGELNYALHN